MLSVVLATRNPGKVAEISSILSGLPLQIKSLLELPELPEIVEDQDTLEGNALKKARHVYAQLHQPTIADDSGLEVYSLAMKPGVLSARYAGEGVTYGENNRKLLRALSGVPFPQRKARFRCVAVFKGTEIEWSVEGVCPGSIAEEPRGEGGFGYDPLFIPDGFDLTFGQLPAETKNRMSHRAHAFFLLKDILREYVNKIG